MEKHGRFCWNELLTRDVEGAKAFFKKFVGWDAEDHDMGGGFVYTVFKQGDDMIGGMMPMPAEMPDSVPPHWFSYIGVDNVDAELARVVDCGGSVMKGPWDVGDFGRMAIIQDTSGGAVALWQTLRKDD